MKGCTSLVLVWVQQAPSKTQILGDTSLVGACLCPDPAGYGHRTPCGKAGVPLVRRRGLAYLRLAEEAE